MRVNIRLLYISIRGISNDTKDTIVVYLSHVLVVIINI